MTDSTDKPDKPVGRKSRKWTRRRFLKLVGLGAAGTIAASALDAFFIEPWLIDVTHPTVMIDSLGHAWDGVRIAHVTDIHYGPVVDMDFVREIVQTTIAQSADLILMTGDYSTHGTGLVRELGKVLAKLEAPLGKFATLGNHDYHGGPGRVTDLLRSAGVTVLANSHVILELGGAKLCIVGIEDMWQGRPSLERALAGVPESVPRILLCHNPDFAEKMSAEARVDLMLCGHTHGGQVKIPFGPRPILPVRYRKYAAGLNTGPHCRVYTSRGLGMLGIGSVGWRFNCRPELPIITLRSASRSTADHPSATSSPGS